MREKREIKIFLLVMAFFAAACWLRYFDHTINPQDTTAFAFSYRYGFISRGSWGAFWNWQDILRDGSDDL